MDGYEPPLDDIRFVLEHVVDLPGIAALPGLDHADIDTSMTLLEEYGRLVADVVAPLERVGDTQGARLDVDTGEVATPDGFRTAYDQYVAGSWCSVPFDPDHGGGGFPWTVGLAMQELLASACLAFSVCPLLTQGAIDMLAHHGDESQQERYLRPMVSGEWTGTMNLTEPDAGSDVGALRTRAEPAADGTWRISGQKIFITYGEHDFTDNIVHLVLARVPDAPPGTKGISCFIVPKFLLNDDGSLGERNGVRCISIEHKMGIHGSPTCVLEYDDAVGELIGEANEGMAYMFTMMNTARLSVGLQGLAVGERAYQRAVAYAKDRHQGRAVGAPAGTSSPIVDHADVRRMLLTSRALLEAMRAVLYMHAAEIDRARHHPDSTAREAHQEVVDLLTPVVKAWCTDIGTDVCSLAIQVYGGMGYIEEAGVAQHYRDMRIAAIYEGTNGIQAIDLVGRKLPMRGGGVVKDHLALMAALDADLADAGDDFASIRTALADGVAALTDATRIVTEHAVVDVNDALSAATPYLRMYGTVLGGWHVARAALAARDTPWSADKATVARFYCEQLLPTARGLLGAVAAPKRDLFAIDF